MSSPSVSTAGPLHMLCSLWDLLSLPRMPQTHLLLFLSLSPYQFRSKENYLNFKVGSFIKIVPDDRCYLCLFFDSGQLSILNFTLHVSFQFRLDPSTCDTGPRDGLKGVKKGKQ